ncbi:transposase [Candidatus Poriferisodalis sp.]|uniref:transposase n=1 Tax=Candidatus Poriferisodalis sp. TaxID=3101277 RepID=UPI003B013760
MRSAGVSADDIAERLGRHPSTIYRELGRCGGVEGVYDAEAAQAEARLRALRPKAAKLEAGPALAGEVNDRLGLCWSPHAISADLAAVGASVCAEAIYRAVCSGRCLGDDAWKCLPRQQRCRRRRSRRGDKASPLGERPAAAADRSEPGRWEGDPSSFVGMGAAQRNTPGPQPPATVDHRGQPQHDAPPTPQLTISRRHLHSTHSQPPIELAHLLATLPDGPKPVGPRGRQRDRTSGWKPPGRPHADLRVSLHRLQTDLRALPELR